MPDPAPSTNKPGINLGTAMALVVGNMIGMGVFLSLGFQAASLASPFVIAMVWLVGGFVSLLGGLCYAELGAALPKSGGEYRFLSRIYTPGIGFIAGWISLIAGFPGPVALYGLAFGEHLGSVLGYPSWWMARGLGTVVILLITACHLFTLRLSGWTQVISTSLKVILLGGGIILCFCFNPQPQAISFAPGKDAMDSIFSASFVTSLYWVFFAYSGWNSICYIADEVRQPQRNLPRAILFSVVLVTLIYLGVNCGMLLAAPMSVLASPDHITQPALTAASQLFGDNGARVTGCLIALGLVATLSANTWVGPRVSQAIGRDYKLLGMLARTNRHGIPTFGICCQSGLALLILWMLPRPEDIITYVEFLLQTSVLLTVLGVVVLRHREPDLPRPFRVPLGPVIPILFCAYIAWTMGVILTTKPDATRYGLGALVAGIAVYFLARGENRAAGK